MTPLFPISDDPLSPRDQLNTVPSFAVSWTRKNGKKTGNSYPTPQEAQAQAARLSARGFTDIEIKLQYIAGHVL